MTEQVRFTVGPSGPVADSRLLPAVDPDQEASFVTGADLEGHPDNVELPDGAVPEGAVSEDSPYSGRLPAAEDLEALVADIDVEDIDGVGFDQDDAPSAGGS